MDDDDPNDPRHPDHDLSEQAPLYLDNVYRRPWFTRRWVLLVVLAVLVTGLLLPFVR